MLISDMSGYFEPSEFMSYKTCFYQIVNQVCDYKILYPSKLKKTDVKNGLRYQHYEINGKIYKSIYTSSKLSANYPFKLMDELITKYEKGRLIRKVKFKGCSCRPYKKAKQLDIFDFMN